MPEAEESIGLTETGFRLFVLKRSFDLAEKIIWYGLIGWGIYWAADAVRILAGKVTIANFLVDVIFSREGDYGVPWIVAICCGLWGYFEHRLRLTKTEHFHSHIRELEKRHDPNRTGSGLLPTGETNPRDQRL